MGVRVLNKRGDAKRESSGIHRSLTFSNDVREMIEKHTKNCVFVWVLLYVESEKNKRGKLRDIPCYYY